MTSIENEIELQTWLENAPTPVVVPVRLALGKDPSISWERRHTALWFSVYQLTRFTALLLLSETVHRIIDPIQWSSSQSKAYQAVIQALVQIQAPTFADWLRLLETLLKYRQQLELQLNGDAETLQQLSDGAKAKLTPLPAVLQPEVKPGESPTWLHGFRLLRNSTAHGGTLSEETCCQDLETFLPYLRQLITGPFAFLSQGALLSLHNNPEADRLWVWRYNGAQSTEHWFEAEEHEAMAAQFIESPLIVHWQGSERWLPVYPWFLYCQEPEVPQGLLEGFLLNENLQRWVYLDQERRQALHEPPRSLHYWEGAHQQLMTALQRWTPHWDADRKTMTPWKLRHAIDYYTWLQTAQCTEAKKYIPSAYLERPVDTELRQFCFRSPLKAEYPYRAVCLAGELGRGKSALLTHLALHAAQWKRPREEEPLLLFFRCDGGATKAEIRQGDVLFQNLAPPLGLKVGALTPQETPRGYSSFADFFTHLDQSFQRQEAPCRLILLIDAINEAVDPEAMLRGVIDCVQHGRRFAWLRVIFSVRTSWLFTLRHHQAAHGSQEDDLLAPIYEWLLPCPWKARDALDRWQWDLPPLTLPECRAIYHRYQQNPDLPACQDPFENLQTYWKNDDGLLRNPLYLHFWMEAFHNRYAPPVAGMEALFECWLQRKFEIKQSLWHNLYTLLDWLWQQQRVQLDPAAALEFLQQTQNTPRRDQFNLLEGLIAEGLLIKPDRNGAVQFPFESLVAVCLARYLRQRFTPMPPVSTEPLFQETSTWPTTFFLALALWIDSLLQHRAYAWVAELLKEEAILQQAWPQSLIRWIMRPEGPLSEGELSWKDIFPALMQHCSPLIQAHMAFQIIWDWSRTLPRQYGTYPAQITLNQWAVEFYRQWAQDGSAEAVRDLFVSLNKMGDVYLKLNQVQQALQVYQDSLQLSQKLADSGSAEAVRDLSVSLDNMGNVYLKLNQVQQALQVYQDSLQLSQKLADSGSAEAVRDLSVSLDNMGDVYLKLNQVQQALQVYQDSLQLRQKLADSGSAEAVRDLSVSLNKMGDVYQPFQGDEKH